MSTKREMDNFAVVYSIPPNGALYLPYFHISASLCSRHQMKPELNTSLFVWEAGKCENLNQGFSMVVRILWNDLLRHSHQSC